MAPAIKRLPLILLILFSAYFFIGCHTVSKQPADTRAIEPISEVKPLKTRNDPVTGMEFVWVPDGCYEMGCGSWTSDCLREEHPAHEVCIDGFWLGKYEATQGEWTQMMGFNNSHFNKGKNYPVENVSRNEAIKFIDQLNAKNKGMFKFRLPSEAEWEYAARSGGRAEKFAGGNNAKAVAWHQANSRETTHTVGKKMPNGLGLYDMSGNVWEWSADKYIIGAYKKHAKNNPIITESRSKHYILRGGGWNSAARLVRCAQRMEYPSGRRNRNIGFRLVMEEKP